MLNNPARVTSNIKLNNNTFLLECYAPNIAAVISPGQFCNIKVSDSDFPLLRRPFSVCDVENESIYFMFNVVGEGTKILSRKLAGDSIDILGPLGKGFTYDSKIDLAIFVAGGLGVAPFPFLQKKLSKVTETRSFLGFNSSSDIISYGLNNFTIATEDGSEGIKGNVLDALKSHSRLLEKNNLKIFACGPNPMLKAVQSFCFKNNLDCELSVECAMACGFGICQGCPIEGLEEDKYFLVCKDGPVFSGGDVKL